MRKSVIFLILFVFAISFAVHAQEVHSTKKTGIATGKFILGKQVNTYSKLCYVYGLIEGIMCNSEDLVTLYPNQTRNQIFVKLKKYYESHPKEINRPIIELLFSGCK
jgi:hypothetical protein